MDDWKDFYPDAAEANSRGEMEPLWGSVTVQVYVDANHAGNLANRRSHSGVPLYVGNSLINLYSKRQNTFESSSFGSEFVALRISTDMVEARRYKFRTFDVNLEGPEEVYYYNNSVVKNSIVPYSVFNKRHNAICYHIVIEYQADGTLRVGWIPGEYNLADLFTKTKMTGNMRHGMVELMF